VAATLTDPLLGHLVDGRYEVLSRIARGGMATVYLAIDRRLDREVALKVMHPHLAEGTTGSEFIARFRREARAAARLTHPGLVGVLDQGVDGDTSYLAMEYVEGTNLRRRLTENGPLAVGDALRTVESVLEALAVAHRSGLVHRDVKPENVLIATDERIKVADFGLARAVTEVTWTTTGTVLGTVAYLAPELVTHGSSDARTDIYAVGILLYETLTGRQPFTGETPIQVAYQHVNADAPAPSDVVPWLPSEIDDLVESLAAREPAERPADAAAALQLVRRTRAALDDDLLRRHADAPARPVPAGDDEDHVPDDAPSDPDATESLAVAADGQDGLRRTIALKVGDGVAPLAAPAATASPGRRRRLLRWAVVAIAVLALLGTGTWWFLTSGPGAFRAVPGGLVGAERAAAEATLEEAGLAVDVTEAFDPEVAAGLVVSTSPAEGERVRKDGTVAVVVSKGPDMRVVPPDLVGKPFGDVVAALEAAGFVVPDPARQFHDDFGPDTVISLSQEPGASLPLGTTITLLVSDGPAPVTVPTVTGKERQAGIVELEAAGLVVEVPTEDFSETVPAGAIISQSPEGGSAGHRGDTVTLVVSKGPPLVAVPDVVNTDVDEAVAILEQAGFVVKVDKGWFWDRMVVDQDPDKDTQLPKGSTVTIFVR